MHPPQRPSTAAYALVPPGRACQAAYTCLTLCHPPLPYPQPDSFHEQLIADIKAGSVNGLREWVTPGEGAIHGWFIFLKVRMCAGCAPEREGHCGVGPGCLQAGYLHSCRPRSLPSSPLLSLPTHSLSPPNLFLQNHDYADFFPHNVALTAAKAKVAVAN